MQMTGWMTYGKMAALAGITGAILAGGISFAIPDQYVCAASMLMTAASPELVMPALGEADRAILSRDNLAALIRNPQLNLYPRERTRRPVEDVAWNEFRKHLHIVPYRMSGRAGEQAFHIVFAYPDKYKVKAVVAELVGEFMQWNLDHPQPIPRTLSLLEDPILPEKPTSPVRPAFAIIGLMGGALTGILSLLIWRRTQNYAVVTLSIPKDAKRFVDSQIAAGPFHSVSDYVRELIRADEQRHK